MKNALIVFLLSLSFPFLAVSQNYAKLEQAFSAEELSNIKAKGASQVEYLVFKANNCYNTQDLSGKKDISNQPDITALNQLKASPEVADINASNFNKATFNPLLYKTEGIENLTYYRVGETGVLLQLYSEKQCQSMFKK